MAKDRPFNKLSLAMGIVEGADAELASPLSPAERELVEQLSLFLAERWYERASLEGASAAAKLLDLHDKNRHRAIGTIVSMVDVLRALSSGVGHEFFDVLDDAAEKH